MKYISKYINFINESSLVEDGPGKQLQDFLDSNLESLVVSMIDDGYQVASLKYFTADHTFYDLDVSKEIPTPEEFELDVIRNIKSTRRGSPSISNGIGYDGKIGILFHKHIKFDELGLKKRLTMRERENQHKLAYRRLDRQNENIIKNFIKFSPEYEYQKTSYLDTNGIHLEYFIWPIKYRDYKKK